MNFYTGSYFLPMQLAKYNLEKKVQEQVTVFDSSCGAFVHEDCSSHSKKSRFIVASKNISFNNIYADSVLFLELIKHNLSVEQYFPTKGCG